MSCNNDNNLNQAKSSAVKNNNNANSVNNSFINTNNSGISNNCNNNSSIYSHSSRINSVGPSMQYNAHDGGINQSLDLISRFYNSCIASSYNQSRYAAGKDASMDCKQKFKTMKDRSYSEGHYRPEYPYENGDVSVDGVHMDVVHMEGDVDMTGYDDPSLVIQLLLIYFLNDLSFLESC
ncbi:hypothetical protein HELRODRAFT_166072 [Helobdella robusta]|uniref:Uncharacterized protein n=1 Tax=Helobdella robusta TaxID=6412 RepID=T1EXP4_HELRO|nr:hypothetical protein HELRODRAFT_166072 [Helobdella robusta]ESN90406.1 hypothetical protein HELRODRAFT_166072 [Helobdella robusta]